MRLDGFEPRLIAITLSRRNLLTLLAKLDGYPSKSACSIYLPGEGFDPTIFVHAEPDEVHYGTRPEPPGAMHPDTEARLSGSSDSTPHPEAQP